MPREQPITKTFNITTSPEVMKCIERFFALLHWNSRFGHSSIFAMPLDCDGSDKVTVDPVPEHAKEVELIGGVGFDVEIAQPYSYGGKFEAKHRSIYRVKDKKLYRQRVNKINDEYKGYHEEELIKDRSEN